MDFICTRTKNCCVLHLRGNNLSYEEKELLNKEINRLTAKEKHLAIDVSKLKYANSQVLGQFLIAFKAMQKRSGFFAIVGAKGPVRDLLRITAMDKVFVLFEDMKAFEKAL